MVSIIRSSVAPLAGSVRQGQRPRTLHIFV
jgi:hypothetical protein